MITPIQDTEVCTWLQGHIEATYQQLVKAFGLPNSQGDTTKTDAEWLLSTDKGVATIYNWKNGKAYMGKNGDTIENITFWNIGGTNPIVVEEIKNYLNN